MNFDNLGDSAETEGLETGQINDADMMNEFGFAGATKGKRRVGETTIVVIAALMVAAGGLYGMRWLGSQSGTTNTDGALEAKVEAFLQKIVGTEATIAESSRAAINPDAIKKRLADDRTGKQVPLNQTKQNPFLRQDDGHQESAGNTNTNVTKAIDPAELERQRLARLQQRLETAASDLWVTSIVGRAGRRIAQIEVGTQKFHLAVGQEIVIDSTTKFVIERIDAMSVLLSAGGLEFTIILGE